MSERIRRCVTITEVTAATTTMHGGMSPAPVETLHMSLKPLAENPEEHLEAALRNRDLVSVDLGIETRKWVVARLVHKANVEAVDVSHAGAGAEDFETGIPETDALVTDTPGLPLAIMVADCAPVFFHDPVKQAVGIAHAGWGGAVQRVAAATVAKMTDSFGTDPADLIVEIGPCLAPFSMEFGPDSVHKAHDAFPGLPVVHYDYGPKPHLDLWNMLHIQLLEAGVRPDRVHNQRVDTLTSSDVYSARRAPGIGRFAGIISL